MHDCIYLRFKNPPRTQEKKLNAPTLAYLNSGSAAMHFSPHVLSANHAAPVAFAIKPHRPAHSQHYTQKRRKVNNYTNITHKKHIQITSMTLGKV